MFGIQLFVFVPFRSSKLFLPLQFRFEHDSSMQFKAKYENKKKTCHPSHYNCVMSPLKWAQANLRNKKRKKMTTKTEKKK